VVGRSPVTNRYRRGTRPGHLANTLVRSPDAWARWPGGQVDHLGLDSGLSAARTSVTRQGGSRSKFAKGSKIAKLLWRSSNPPPQFGNPKWPPSCWLATFAPLAGAPGVFTARLLQRAAQGTGPGLAASMYAYPRLFGCGFAALCPYIDAMPVCPCLSRRAYRLWPVAIGLPASGKSWRARAPTNQSGCDERFGPLLLGAARFLATPLSRRDPGSDRTLRTFSSGTVDCR
jgi:hypothetical protein